MSTSPRNSTPDDFSRRVHDAMNRAQRGAQQPGAGAPGTAGMDAGQVVSSDQLNAAMAQQTVGGSTGAAASGASAVAAQPTEASGDQTQQAAVESTGPLGAGNWEVRAGDCVSSIARRVGHFWETLWDDSQNSALREARVNPNVLLPGDLLFVPELRRKEEAAAYEQRHRFRRLGEPALLRLRLTLEPADVVGDEEDAQAQESDRRAAAGADPNSVTGRDEPDEPEPVADEPRANAPYILVIDGAVSEGTTDADGRIEVPIPGNARLGRLTLYPGSEQEETLALRLGHVAPISELSGVKQRLANLTFDCGEFNERETPQLDAALRAFQTKHGLPVTGQADAATRDKLLAEHGC
jgi:N-acetylmuramoyl-L-alanine amidase